MDFEKLMELAKSQEGRAVIIEFIAEIKQELYPAVALMRDTVGVDADKAFDEVLKWGARKNKVSYDAYVEVGFTRDEALSLVINENVQRTAVMRSISAKN